MLLAYVVFDFEKIISLEKFEALNIIVWMICLPISIVITHEWSSGKNFIGLQVLASIILLIIVIGAKNRAYIFWDKNILDVLTIGLAFIPIITSFYIEFITLLNQRGVFWTHLRRNYIFIIIVDLVVALMLAIIFCKKNKQVQNWKSIVYPIIIVGISCLWLQIPISAEYTADMFETANSSVLISDFWNFGKIPIVQHYGGHMMSGVWEGLIYALLNNDYVGAIFSPYAGYAALIIVISFYYFVKTIWNEDAAILFVLFFPFYNSVNYWGLGMLVAMAALFYIRKNSYIRAILFWGMCIWCALYRLDLGFPFIIAGMISLIIYSVKEKNGTAIKQLSVTLIVWGIIGIIIWGSICVLTGVKPINRLLEFLYINLSNSNWAFADIGDASLMIFPYTYILLPFICAVALIYSVFSKQIRDDVGIERWVLLMILGFTYFFNFSRALVRHSLVEMALNICTWSAYIYLSMFISVVFNKRKLFLPSFTIFVLLATLFLSDGIFKEMCIADGAMGHIGTYSETWTLGRFAEEEAPIGKTASTYWEQLRKKREIIQRVKWAPDLIEKVKGYQIIMDSLLNEGETFVDLINKSTVYSLINRENPAYVSQSPLQLSGQFTQEQFIKEIDSVPLVLMPCDWNNDRLSESMDTVPNAYRYYKVFEYIYQTYVPLCKYEDDFAVWCLPDRYDAFSKKINEIRNEMDIQRLIDANNLSKILLNSIELRMNSKGTLDLGYTNVDSTVSEIQSLGNLNDYYGNNLTVAIGYETSIFDELELFYTTEKGEAYSEEKVLKYNCTENNGIAYFKVPITKFMKIKFKIPEDEHIKITSFKIVPINCSLIEYGYDGPYLQKDNVTYSFLPAVHNYELNKLPLIWAERDKKKSCQNPLITDCKYSDGYYRFKLKSEQLGKEGNYLKIKVTYEGTDQNGKIKPNDEFVNATMRIGTWLDGKFETKYVYAFTIEEGTHEYIFRISSDYYWYLKTANAIKIECDGQLIGVNMQILKGD